MKWENSGHDTMIVNNRSARWIRLCRGCYRIFMYNHNEEFCSVVGISYATNKQVAKSKCKKLHSRGC